MVKDTDKSEVKRFTQFSVVGVSNTVIDIVVFNLFLWLQTPATIAAGLSFIAANINSYLANRHWTFDDKKSVRPFLQYGKYLLTSLIGLLINLGVMKLALGINVGISEFYLVNGAKLIAIALTVLWNYITSRFLIFK